MATIKNTKNKCWWWCGDKGTFIHCWWECKLVQTLWRLLKKLKIELLYDPAITLLGICPKECVNQVTIKAPADPWLLQHYS
jgi:IS1 family transposase